MPSPIPVLQQPLSGVAPLRISNAHDTGLRCVHLSLVYSTCLFCHADLGRNEVIEHFPVGRRLAYDAEKGRLWVVCRKCERWNLTPQEERWEAIEDAERLYRGTRLRASTDNVGLARLREGTELVRIGAPLRPEFAAWRYGDQFGWRRSRQVLISGGGIAVVVGVLAGGAAAGVGIGGFAWGISEVVQRLVHGNPTAVIARVPFDGTLVPVQRRALEGALLRESSVGPFALSLPMPARPPLQLDGEDAVRAASVLLPAANRFGGSRRDVGDAVRRIEGAGGPEGLLDSAGRLFSTRRNRSARGLSWHGNRWARNAPGPAFGLEKVSRLALEMALHEEQERRAMEGELAPLRRAWEEAEEIAAIADDLLLPASIGARLDQLKARSTARAGAASSLPSDSGSASNS